MEERNRWYLDRIGEEITILKELPESVGFYLMEDLLGYFMHIVKIYLRMYPNLEIEES